MRKIGIALALALGACAQTTLDERAYLGMNAGYQFGATTVSAIAPRLSEERRAQIDSKRVEVFTAVCRARLAYNLANPELGRSSTPRCVEALGPNPRVSDYDSEILAAGQLLSELHALVIGQED